MYNVYMFVFATLPGFWTVYVFPFVPLNLSPGRCSICCRCKGLKFNRFWRGGNAKVDHDQIQRLFDVAELILLHNASSPDVYMYMLTLAC
jgi:hypothetical protein